jgi:protein-tyrosine phosphatase
MGTESVAGRNIPIASVPNLRDLGGWAAPGGRVRAGLIYRSAEFTDLQGDDAAAFGQLGIRSVYDLRTTDERTQSPNQVPAGTEYIIVDVLRDASGASPALMPKILGDPAFAADFLGGGKAVSIFEGAYRQIVSIGSALTGYQQFFTDIAEPEHRPALFHCQTGKDRTGWAAASLLLLLGVSKDDVYADYMLTNDQLLPALKPMIDQFVAAGGEAALLTPVLGVQASYLDAAIDEMETRFGSVEGYFKDGLGFDDDWIAAIRASYLEPA